MEKIILIHPLTVKGEEVKEIILNFEAIRGKDLIEAEKEVRMLGDTTPTVFLSMNFQAGIAAKMIGVPVDEIMEMNSADFKKIIVPVASFLLS